MRVSQIFAQGGGHGYGGDCKYRCDDCYDYYYTSEDFYRHGYHCYHGCGDEHYSHGGFLGLY
jgi:hypothetical protein